ncbi:DJ-1/PfpI family protein [Jeongeupia chitinilytica]|uniref:DJ-1 family protein n=1 Tax=Jeongeupia chitinilytica TaxID=1041641 RepID=A0ABQ3GYZ6_9NEIS|nr:DJ-1/PfpI family protein [Jeongeupia chitinilytica]GHD62098.1 DJ-1 family protein [Jeongeupia chitinilytica]
MLKKICLPAMLGLMLSLPGHAADAGKRVLLVVASYKVKASEYTDTRAALEKAGNKIVVASTGLDPAWTDTSLQIKPDLKIADAKAGDYDAVAIIGGEGSALELWDDAPLHQLVQNAARADKIVAAICMAPGALAKAGLLKGKNATAYPLQSAFGVLKAGGATYLEQRVVVDGKIVTGRNPEAGPEFGATLAALLASR